jgi:tRNA pseudouridine38-40 synthase
MRVACRLIECSSTKELATPVGRRRVTRRKPFRAICSAPPATSWATVDIGGAGRTDAGVHARAQVAHLRAHKTIDPLLLTRKINDLLPHDIHILAAVRARDNFHARHDAVSRVYLYQISTRRTAFAKPFVWWIKDSLDFDAMQSAASAIAGRHDFSAFTDKRLAADESRIVVVERCEAARAGDLILVRIAASHFSGRWCGRWSRFWSRSGAGTRRRSFRG